MRKRNFIILVLLLFALTIIMSPILSLFLPGEFKDHTYRELVYRIIVNNETKGIEDKKEIVFALLNYVHNHIVTPEGAFPYSGKVFDYLVNGIGWCDYQAKALIKLLAKKDIPARYVMLFDKNNISTHTAVEVYVDGKWRFFDPLNNLYFKKENFLATLEDLSENPGIILENPLLKIAHLQNPPLYRDKIDLYNRILPVNNHPRRSISGTDKINVFDRILDIYLFVLGENFAAKFQDTYLFLRKKSFEREDYRIFFTARNYHLLCRNKLAAASYNKLLSEYPESDYADDSLFFLTMLYAGQKNDFKSAIKTFEELFTKYPSSNWKPLAYYYEGLVYEAMNSREQAAICYMKAQSEGNDSLDPLVRFSGLLESLGDKIHFFSDSVFVLENYNWDPAKEDFDIDFWVRFINRPAGEKVFMQHDEVGLNAWLIDFNEKKKRSALQNRKVSGDGKFMHEYHAVNFSPEVDDWYHIAINKKKSDCSIFINDRPLDVITSNYASSPDSDNWDLAKGDFTIEFKARFENKSKNQAILMQYEEGGENFKGWYINYVAENKTLQIRNNQLEKEYGYFHIDFDPELNRWYHIAIVKNKEDCLFYVDSVSKEIIAKVDWNNPPSLSGELWIGRYFDGYENIYFDGQLDEIRIWNCAKDRNDILTDSRNTLFGNEKNLIGYWSFDEKRGEIVNNLKDKSVLEKPVSYLKL